MFRIKPSLQSTRFSFFFLTIFLFSGCTSTENSVPVSVLDGKVICLDAGHGGTAATDSYRQGAGGEREEWVNLRVAKALAQMLETEGGKVLMTRTTDSIVELKDRAQLALDHQADVFLSIHHNATADTAVNFPIIYFHANASENQASVKLAQLVGKNLLAAIYEGDTTISLASDHAIFPNGGAQVLRRSYGIPGVLGEASFFTNPTEEQRLKQEAYNKQEAEGYLRALKEFFSNPELPIKEKYSLVEIPPFAVLQEAERMDPTARLWKEDFETGIQLYQAGNLDSAYQLLTRSARSFPDSYLAGQAHYLRAEILQQMDSTKAAESNFLRASEFYVTLSPVTDQ